MPASQLASQPASQLDSQPASQLAGSPGPFEMCGEAGEDPPVQLRDTHPPPADQVRTH